MKPIQKDTHILGLAPKEQFLLKLVLSNLLSGYLDKTIQDVCIMDNQEAVDAKAASVVGLFNRYNDFTDMLCPESMITRAKPKVLLIKEQMMRYLVIAFNAYDPKACYLGTEHKQMLVNTFEPLKTKVITSSQFQYSASEIELAKRG